jgi:tryptophanyl-tRNA synthetase
MTRPVILTGLRANNDLHIGNYFGALLPLIDMARSHADDYDINLFVPDLHSFTTPIDHSQLQAQIMHNLRIFAAAGLPLDNDNIHIYRQSYVPAHSELTWILDCFAGFDELTRMTQFKDKSGQITENNFRVRQSSKVINRFGDHFVNAAAVQDKINKVKLFSGNDEELKNYIIDLIHDVEVGGHAVTRAFQDITVFKNDHINNLPVSVGLYNYPVLMAADILLYGATYVPVGDDQSQHLEFTRDIAERMNNKFGELFTVPKAVKEQHSFFGKDQGLRIKDLSDPTKKMSKSDESDKGVIFLGDDPDEAAKKVASATTDSLGNINFDMDKQAGISNLLQISALLSGDATDKVAKDWQGKASYGDLKSHVAEQIKQFLSEFQAKLAAVDENRLQAKLAADETAMNEAANATLLRVQKAVGLR